jgi:hypothetical protein
MIYHFKDDLKTLIYKLGTPLKYSNEFTFIPFKVDSNEFITQSPKVFVPFGIQENDKSKDYIMISFQNKDNDLYTNKFIDDLNYIYELINDHFKDNFKVNHFFKKYKGETIMNLKTDKSSLIFDSYKNKCDDLPIYSYASFIIQLAGIWITTDKVSTNQVWFQWYNLQSRLENNISLSGYAFKDSIPGHIPGHIPKPPPLPIPIAPPLPKQNIDKYKKMITMGIPSAAVNQQKQIDAKSSINSEMLLSVKLKKGKSKKEILKSDMNGFEAPSLDSLQQALRNLRNTIKGQ